MIIRDGFFRIEGGQGSISTIACPPGACIQSNCSVGYQDFLCSKCSENYFKVGNLQSTTRCKECKSSMMSAVESMAVISFGLLVIAYVIFKRVKAVAKIKEAVSPDGKVNASSVTSASTVIQRLAIDHLQIVTIIGRLDIEWPLFIKNMFGVFESASSFSLQATLGELDGGGFKCLFYSSSIPLPVNELLSNVGVTIFATVVVTIVWSLYLGIRRNSSTARFSDRIIMSTVAIFFFMYSTIVRSLFQNFKCINIRGDRHTYLEGALDVQCYGADHMYWIIRICLPVLILLVILPPLVTFIILWRQPTRASDTRTISRYGFLYAGMFVSLSSLFHFPTCLNFYFYLYLDRGRLFAPHL